MKNSSTLDSLNLTLALSDAVYNATKEAIDEVSKEAVSKVKKNSPRRSNGGTYAKGWAKQITAGRLTYGATVYGKSGTYQLAHLLENGHATRNGGRTKAIAHIEPVDEWAAEELPKRIMQKLEEMKI